MLKSLALGSLFATGCWTSAQPAPAPKRLIVKDIVQPVQIEKQEVAGDPQGEEDGEEGGEEGGVYGGVVGGVIGGVGAPPPPPPPPPVAMNVAPTMLEGSRIAGDKDIRPDDATKAAMVKAGKDNVVTSLKLCLDQLGAITAVSLLKSSGFPSYDAKLMVTIRATWRYRPYFVNGQAHPVCTAVTFIYAP